MSTLGWTLEWRTALARRRLFVLNLLIPLLLVLPIATAGAPPHHAAAVYAVLFVLFGTFGAAIPLLRDAERGFVRRLALTRTAPAGLLAGRALAGAGIDTLQLLPALAVVLWTAPERPLALLAVLPATLLFANLLGTWIAALARSVAEGALFCAVGALLLLHASGTFRTPAPDSIGALVERLAPFRALHEVLLRSGGAAIAFDGATALGAGLLVIGALTVVAARRLLRALARADGRG